MIRGIHHIALNTADLDRLRDFHVDVIGFVPAVPEHRWARERPLDFGDIKAVYGPDPDGNVIGIQQATRDQAFALAQLCTVSFA